MLKKQLLFLCRIKNETIMEETAIEIKAKKKPVPYKWYKEVCNEMAREIMQAKIAPAMQQKRIDAVVASGLDYEIMLGNNGCSWKIPLSDLRQYLANAMAVDVDAKVKEWEEFKATHEGIKGLDGNLSAAKKEAELKKIKHPSFNDNKDYKFLHNLMNKYYLTNAQTNNLMIFMSKIELI